MSKPFSLKGILSPSAVPHYSPLSGAKDPAVPNGVLMAPPAPEMPLPVPQGVLAAPMGGPEMPEAAVPAPMTQQPSSAVVERKKFKPFSKENRQDTLLAIGTGLLSRPDSFAAGIGAAGEKLGALRKKYDDRQKPVHAVGGPDDAFEVVTNPETGEQTFKEIPAFTGYLDRKNRAKGAPSAKDTVAATASLADYVGRLPKEQQGSAWQLGKAWLEQQGYTINLPDAYSSGGGGVVAGVGVSPTARMNNDRGIAAGKRAQANADRAHVIRERSDERSERRFRRGPVSSAAPQSSKLPSGFRLDGN